MIKNILVIYFRIHNTDVLVVWILELLLLLLFLGEKGDVVVFVIDDDVEGVESSLISL